MPYACGECHAQWLSFRATNATQTTNRDARLPKMIHSGATTRTAPAKELLRSSRLHIATHFLRPINSIATVLQSQPPELATSSAAVTGLQMASLLTSCRACDREPESRYGTPVPCGHGSTCSRRFRD